MSSQNSNMSASKKGSVKLRAGETGKDGGGSSSSTVDDVLTKPTQPLESTVEEENFESDVSDGDEASATEEGDLEAVIKLCDIDQGAFAFQLMVPREHYNDAFKDVLELELKDRPRKIGKNGSETTERLDPRTFGKGRKMSELKRAQVQKFIEFWGRLRKDVRLSISQKYVEPEEQHASSSRSMPAPTTVKATNASTAAAKATNATNVSAKAPVVPLTPLSVVENALLETPQPKGVTAAVSSLSTSTPATKKTTSTGSCAGWDKHDMARLLHIFTLPELAMEWDRVFGVMDRQTLDAVHSQKAEDLNAWNVIAAAFNDRKQNQSSPYYFENAACIVEPGTANWEIRHKATISAKLASRVWSLDPCAMKNDKGMEYPDRSWDWMKALWMKLKGRLALAWNNWNRSGNQAGDSKTMEGRDDWVDFCDGDAWLMYAILVLKPSDFEQRVGRQIAADSGGRASGINDDKNDSKSIFDVTESQKRSARTVQRDAKSLRDHDFALDKARLELDKADREKQREIADRESKAKVERDNRDAETQRELAIVEKMREFDKERAMQMLEKMFNLGKRPRSEDEDDK